ncbi:hypothetical protein WR25_19752 isoform B [Diploscapter pachys]|uniref:Globin family profile domain-containing protein n=1 Tax=Diploscapter pachys TaxID=2018661 RepID=A0A2A2LPX5_9BILA|nr:hypothetical protein WR25_19752 isoform B [Diploscapter pachys]
MMGAARAGLYKKRVTPLSNAKNAKNKKKSLVPSSSSSSNGLTSKSNSLSVPEDGPAMTRRRSGSVPAIKIDTLASVWNLKFEHARALKMTWQRLCEPPRSNCKGIVNLVERVWEKLDSKDKNIREIFYKAAFVDSMQERCERRRSATIATLRDHTHFFVSLISHCILALDIEPSHILNHLDTIGRNHAYLKQYGFRSTHWEKVGEYFVDIVVIQDCVRGFPEACKAWTIFIAAIVDRLRAAPRRESCQISPAPSISSLPNAGLRRGSTTSMLNGSGSSANGSVSSLNGTGAQLTVCAQKIPRHNRGSFCEVRDKDKDMLKIAVEHHRRASESDFLNMAALKESLAHAASMTINAQNANNTVAT